MGSLTGLDTNVLVRYVTRDHPEQAQAARDFIEGAEARGERLYVSHVVLCELVWTLAGRGYRYSRHDIAALLLRLLETAVFEIEARDVVGVALADFAGGPGGFADCLIGRIHQATGCRDTASFDRRLASSGLFAVLDLGPGQ